MRIRSYAVLSAIVAVLGISLMTGCATQRTSAKPQPKQPERVLSNSFVLQTEAVRLSKSAPAAADLGGTFDAVITAHALTQVAGVLVTDMVPEGATLVKTDPPAQVNGKQLTWRLDNLSAGETRKLIVTLKADKEGDLASCTTVTAIPQGCLSTVVGRPVLTIAKTGPEKARLGAEVEYLITVRNTGSALARDVVITDTLPVGLKHASGNQSLTISVGDLAPDTAKAYRVKATTTQRGKLCNPAVAKAGNAGEVKAEACTVVVEPKLEISKTGTKEQFIGKIAEYSITVTNPGDEPLTNVVVTDNAPLATRIVSAEGGTVAGNAATWKIAQLAGGAKQSYKLTLTSAAAGNHCNAVSASSAEGLTAKAESCTVWKGQAALLIEVVDNPDPILVGDATTFTIRVTNQGTANDTNIKIVANFGKEIDPTSAAGQTVGTVSGKSVTFAPVATLAPKQTVSWTISAKGAATGDHRLKVLLTSELLGTPVTEEESTHVY